MARTRCLSDSRQSHRRLSLLRRRGVYGHRRAPVQTHRPDHNHSPDDPPQHFHNANNGREDVSSLDIHRVTPPPPYPSLPLSMLLSVVVMAVYLEEVVVRPPGFRRGIRLFGQFPYLLSIIWVWLLCLILTVTNLEPQGSPIRTDRNETIAVLKESDWFNLPYPGGSILILNNP